MGTYVLILCTSTYIERAQRTFGFGALNLAALQEGAVHTYVDIDVIIHMEACIIHRHENIYTHTHINHMRFYLHIHRVHHTCHHPHSPGRTHTYKYIGIDM